MRIRQFDPRPTALVGLDKSVGEGQVALAAVFSLGFEPKLIWAGGYFGPWDWEAVIRSRLARFLVVLGRPLTLIHLE